MNPPVVDPVGVDVVPGFDRVNEVKNVLDVVAGTRELRVAARVRAVPSGVPRGSYRSSVLFMNLTVSMSALGESKPMLHSAHSRVKCGAVGAA